MKKLFLLGIVVGSCHSAVGMFLAQFVRPRTQKTLVIAQRLLVKRATLHSSAIIASHGEKRSVSLSCCQKIGQIRHDESILKYYCKWVFSGISERNNPDIKPSELIDWLEKDLFENESKRFGRHLQYMSAHAYIQCFLKNQRRSLDAKFIEKYEELQDIQEAWRWFGAYFEENALKKPISKHVKKIVEQDRKLLDIADMGMDCKIMIIDPRVRE